MREKIYVGFKITGGREIFKSPQEPTWSTHSHLYACSIGPFRTMRGARFYVDHGLGNPHTTSVNACERLATLEAQGKLKG